MTADQVIGFIKAPEKLNQDTLPLLKELIERYPAFEAGWILYLRNLKNLNDSTFEQELFHVAIRIQDRRKLYLFLHEKSIETEITLDITDEKTEVVEDLMIKNLILPAEYQLEKMITQEESAVETGKTIPEKSMKKITLIEKFLEVQPKMPPVNETNSVSPMESQPSGEDFSDELVTETLAMIYAQQGYYKKAIQIFEKLSLKYPEKSTYFAGHIEKIKNLMNN